MQDELKLSWIMWTDFDKIQEKNPFMTVVLGDFNAKSNNWWKESFFRTFILEGLKLNQDFGWELAL